MPPTPLDILRDLTDFISDDESAFLALCVKHDVDCYAEEAGLLLREKIYTTALEVLDLADGKAVPAK